MGERYNAFLSAFNGAALNWDAIFGTGFKQAPKSWVSVYRECSLSELMRAARLGLTAPMAELRHPTFRSEMELLDQFRPKHLVECGISRLGSIYAVPTPDTPRFAFNHERFIVEMKVDPQNCFVGDMDFINRLISFISNNQKNELHRFDTAFKKYWEHLLTLPEFFNWFRPEATTSGVEWVTKTRAPKHLPAVLFMPEILITTAIIDAKHIRVLRREVDEQCFESLYEEDSFLAHEYS